MEQKQVSNILLKAEKRSDLIDIVPVFEGKLDNAFGITHSQIQGTLIRDATGAKDVTFKNAGFRENFTILALHLTAAADLVREVQKPVSSGLNFMDLSSLSKSKMEENPFETNKMELLQFISDIEKAKNFESCNALFIEWFDQLNNRLAKHLKCKASEALEKLNLAKDYLNFEYEQRNVTTISKIDENHELIQETKYQKSGANKEQFTQAITRLSEFERDLAKKYEQEITRGDTISTQLRNLPGVRNYAETSISVFAKSTKSAKFLLKISHSGTIANSLKDTNLAQTIADSNLSTIKPKTLLTLVSPIIGKTDDNRIYEQSQNAAYKQKITYYNAAVNTAKNLPQEMFRSTLDTDIASSVLQTNNSLQPKVQEYVEFFNNDLNGNSNNIFFDNSNIPLMQAVGYVLTNPNTKVHVTCQSGKDRTMIFFMLLTQTALTLEFEQDPTKLTNTNAGFEKKYWEAVISARHSVFLNGEKGCSIGSFGIKSDSIGAVPQIFLPDQDFFITAFAKNNKLQEILKAGWLRKSSYQEIHNNFVKQNAVNIAKECTTDDNMFSMQAFMENWIVPILENELKYYHLEAESSYIPGNAKQKEAIISSLLYNTKPIKVLESFQAALDGKEEVAENENNNDNKKKPKNYSSIQEFAMALNLAKHENDSISILPNNNLAQVIEKFREIVHIQLPKLEIKQPEAKSALSSLSSLFSSKR